MVASTPTETPSTALLSLIHSLRALPTRLIQSPPTQPRRASVAIIIRLRPAEELVFEGHGPEGWTGDVISREDWGEGLELEDFMKLSWVNHSNTVPEILFIRRASPASSPPPGAHHRWASHIAFPGGRQESDDQSAYYTALRETWEEIGIDLAEKEFLNVGRLDEREVTTSLGKRLLMILSPFVFIQTTPISPTPELQAAEISSVHWVPLSLLTPPFSPSRWSHVEIDVSTRLSPRNKFVRWCLRNLIGKMKFGCLLLPDEPAVTAENFDPFGFDETVEGSGSWTNAADGSRFLRLWGLTLGMTLDLISHHPSAPSKLLAEGQNLITSQPSTPVMDYKPQLAPRTPVTTHSTFEDQWEAARKALVEEEKNRAKASEKATQSRRRRGVGPYMTAVFPRFTYPDVNFWIWIFSRRYRQVLKSWELSAIGPSRAADRRINWSGQALATFYTAVRQALVVTLIIRALGVGVGLAGVGYLVFKAMGGGEL
ncbi:hypothetical protein I308_105205 [Cryptococcus tetragattii IND107]|uniref:Nudix hydrolase domain-containing protein n=1 Tax=Cryptococcus tetragattii IND107 TaxID=1296105 RepID=A0ABR3BNV5_9TREE